MSDSFQTTQWSVVLAAGLEPGVAQLEALSSLCQIYWYPLYAYVRRRGYPEPDAQDLTQGFFADILERRDLQRVRPELGRFRSFLLTALKNFMTNEYRKETAHKRGGGVKPLSIDDENFEFRYKNEPATQDTPESLYHRNFANALVGKVLSDLAQEYVDAGKAVLFEELSASMTANRSETETVAHAAALKMSRGAVSTALHRMRTRYGELLRREVAATLVDRDDEGEVESEMREMLKALYS
jgi:RNA polymerase sigma factor (sigma-70 family)